MYEVETKVELTKDEKDKLFERFGRRGYEFRGTTPQRDFYVHAAISPYKDQGGTYDVERYRDEDGRYLYSAKSWDIVDGKLIRKEEERDVTKEEFDREVAAHPDAIKIIKTRDWFWAQYEGHEISITVDAVKFDHSPEIRFFLEAEIGVEDQSKVTETRKIVEDFTKEILDRTELIEAEKMFTMAFEKK